MADVARMPDAHLADAAARAARGGEPRAGGGARGVARRRDAAGARAPANAKVRAVLRAGRGAPLFAPWVLESAPRAAVSRGPRARTALARARAEHGADRRERQVALVVERHDDPPGAHALEHPGECGR